MLSVSVKSCKAPRANQASRNSRTRVAIVRAQKKDDVVSGLPAAFLAASLVLSQVPAIDAVMVQPAHADEEIDESRLSPYERRMLMNQRRRELLQKAREEAEGRDKPSTAEADAAVDEANSERKVAAEALSTNLRARALASYEEAARTNTARFGGLAEKASESSVNVSSSEDAPVKLPEMPDIKLPAFTAPKFSMPAFTAPKVDMPAFEMPKVEMPKVDIPKFEAPSAPVPAAAPAPAPAPPPPPPPPPPPKKVEVPRYVPPPPPPTPAPVVVKKAEPAPKPAPKPAEEPAKKSGKRQGPLPLWLSEFLVLGAFAGVGAASTVYSKEAGAALKAVEGLAKKAADALPK